MCCNECPSFNRLRMDAGDFPTETDYQECPEGADCCKKCPKFDWCDPYGERADYVLMQGIKPGFLLTREE